jgi:two-component system, sensor histidine kinase RegB
VIPELAFGSRAPRPRDFPNPGEQAEVSLPWLARLRWGAVAGQLATILGARYAFGLALPLAPLLGCIGITAATNLWLEVDIRRATPAATRAGALLTLDTLVLTAILGLTGGPTNPFSILYLVHITLAAVMLGAAWTWGLTCLAVACYGLLFLLRSQMDEVHHAGSAFSAHLHGMWLAFAVAAGLTAYFVVQLSAAIKRRDAEIAVIREQAARGERLAALATLAAGAAHELGTPLATIAVAAKELERRLARLPQRDAGALLDDARLIRAELERCRRILDSMTVHSGGTLGEAPARFSAGELLADVLDGLPSEDRERIEVAVTTSRGLDVPRRALAQAIGNLVRNALDATARGPVRLAVEPTSCGLRYAVRDDGPGMSSHVLARAGEPFFSTKPAGRGMGLGLFLSRAIAEQMGGRLDLDSTPGCGATAAIELPSSVVAPEALA